MDQQLIRLDYGHRTVRLDYLQQQRSKHETNSKICLLQRPVPKTCLLQQPTQPNRPPSCVAPVSSHPGAATSAVPYRSPFAAVNLRWRRQQRWVLAVPAAPHHGHSSPHWLRPIAVTPHHASPIPPREAPDIYVVGETTLICVSGGELGKIGVVFGSSVEVWFW